MAALAVVVWLCDGAIPVAAQENTDGSIVLNQTVIPPGAMIGNDGFGWIVHGTYDGVTYAYDEHSAELRVSNSKVLSWQILNFANSWLVACGVKRGSPDCAILRTSLVGVPGEYTVLDFEPEEACLTTPLPFQKVDITINGAVVAQLSPEKPCTGSAALLQNLLAAETFGIKADNDKIDLQYGSYGLKQALALRDWILAQYRAGKLKARPR